MSHPSIERSVMRSYVASIVFVSLAIVLVSAIVTTWVVVQRDDAVASALATTLGVEVHDHRDEGVASLVALVQHELDEQQWLHRTVEVWIGGNRIGGTGDSAHLRLWIDQRGCHLGRVNGIPSRVCTVTSDGDTAVVVASSILPLLTAQLPIIAAIAFAALLACAAFAIIARGVVRRSLEPLRRFERSVERLQAHEAGPVAAQWGAAEVDQLARTFNSLLARIDVAMEREHRFVSNAAHELRTPLTRLRGQIELVSQQSTPDVESSKRLSLAVRSCEELSRSVDALLALARDEPAPSETVDLGEVASDVIGALDADDARRIHLVGASALVRGDPVLLGMAAGNLVDNALKYSGGEVDVRVVEDSQCGSLLVVDQGPGIPESELSSVLEPFVRGGSAQVPVRGAGLGLALVDHVTRLHRGELRLESVSPSGLRATIILPSWRST